MSDVLFTCGHIGLFDSQFPVHLAEEWPDGKLGGCSCAPCHSTQWLQHAGLHTKLLNCSLKIISHSVSTYLCCVWEPLSQAVLFVVVSLVFFLIAHHLCF